MNNKIEEIVKFASKYFGIKESRLLSHDTSDDCSICRYIVWHYLHYEKEFSTRTICEYFGRTKDAVFKGLAKIKSSMNMQMHYRNMYGMFVQEYEKWLNKE